MMVKWDEQSCCQTTNTPNEYNVFLRLDAELDEVAWEWEDYLMAKANYLYALLPDGNALVLERRIEAFNKEDGETIKWYGDYCNGDTTVFDRLAAIAVKEFADKHDIVEYRNELISKHLQSVIDDSKQRLVETQERYVEEMRELQEDQRELVLERQSDIAEAQRELARFENEITETKMTA